MLEIRIAKALAAPTPDMLAVASTILANRPGEISWPSSRKPAYTMSYAVIRTLFRGYPSMKNIAVPK
jgi:hypothetical protein